MAHPFADPSQFVDFTGPNGQVTSIPNQYAGAFQLPPPPPDVTAPSAPGPLPAFDPAELAPPPPPEPLAPVPSIAAPQPRPQPQPPMLTPEEQAQLSGLPAQPQPAPTQRAAPPGPAPTPTPLDDRATAIQAEQEAMLGKGQAVAAGAAEEARIYGEADARAVELEKARAAQREKEIEERDRAKADVNAATDRYVNYKVDENRKWNNMSTGRKIAAAIAVAMSGWGNALARQGNAPNGALEFLMGTIKDDVRLQMDERDQLGKNVGMQKEKFADLRQAMSDNESMYKAAVAGEYEKAANQFRTAGAKSKSEVAKAETDIAVAHLTGEAGKLREEAANTQYARKIDERNFVADQAYKRASLGEQRAGRLQSGQIADRNFLQGQYEFEKNLELQYGKAIADAEKARAAGNDKEAERLEKKAKEERELAIGGFDNKPLVQKDGSVYKAPTTEEAVRLRKKVDSGAEAIRIVDAIKRLRNDHGAEWGNTEAGRQLKGDMAALQLEIKNNAELGVLAGPDMDIISGYVGTGDPTELDAFGSIEKGLDRVRLNIKSKTDRSLRTAGFTGKWEPPDMTAKKDAPEDKRLKEALKVATGQSPGLVNRPTPQQEAVAASLGPEGGKRYLAQLTGGYSLDQERSVNAIANAAQNATDPTARETMIGQLDQIRKTAASPGLRAYAEEVYNAIGSGMYEARDAFIPSKGILGPAKDVVRRAGGER